MMKRVKFSLRNSNLYKKLNLCKRMQKSESQIKQEDSDLSI